jgi:uncharacterized protein YkwD
MKKYILILGIVGWLIFPSVGQNNEPDLTYNKNYSGKHSYKQQFEAESLLYKEINQYRTRNGVKPVSISSKIVTYACQWGNYMTHTHIDPWNDSYFHSKEGPDSLHIPATCSEIIHCIYFDHKPTALEIVSALMYGVARSPENVIGWIDSPGHKRCVVQDVVKYYGVSIFMFQTVHDWYCVYGVVNFSVYE